MTTAGTFMIPAAWRNLTDAGEIHLDLICALSEAFFYSTVKIGNSSRAMASDIIRCLRALEVNESIDSV